MNKMILDLRKEIDQIDVEILYLLKKRYEVVIQIGQIKKNMEINICQPDRIKEVIESKKKLAKKLGLNSKFIEIIYNLIINESMKLEENS